MTKTTESAGTPMLILFMLIVMGVAAIAVVVPVLRHFRRRKKQMWNVSFQTSQPPMDMGKAADAPTNVKPGEQP